MKLLFWIKSKRRNYLNKNIAPKYLRIFSLIDKENRILDAGCGKKAKLSEYLLSKNSSLKITGGDLNKTCEFMHPNFEYSLMDLNQKINAKNFDLVIFADVLEHLKNPKQVLQTFSNHTDKFIISIPNMNFFAYKIFPRLENPPKGESQHICHWTLKKFKELIPKEFKIKKVRYCSDFPEFRWSNIIFPNISFFNQTTILKIERKRDSF